MERVRGQKERGGRNDRQYQTYTRTGRADSRYAPGLYQGGYAERHSADRTRAKGKHRKGVSLRHLQSLGAKVHRAVRDYGVIRSYAAVMTGFFLCTVTAGICGYFSGMGIVQIGFLSTGMFCVGGAGFMALTEPKKVKRKKPVRRFQVYDLNESEYIEVPLPPTKANRGA